MARTVRPNVAWTPVASGRGQGRFSMQDSSNPSAPSRSTRESSGAFNKPLALLAGGLIWIIAFARPVGAEGPVSRGHDDPSETYSELLSYVQQLGDEQPGMGPLQSPHNFSPVDDDSYSALRSFVQQIGAEQPAPGSDKRSPHLSAAADDEPYAALREFVREIGGNASLSADDRRFRL